jgi:hypothetical protein
LACLGWLASNSATICMEAVLGWFILVHTMHAGSHAWLSNLPDCSTVGPPIFLDYDSVALHLVPHPVGHWYLSLLGFGFSSPPRQGCVSCLGGAPATVLYSSSVAFCKRSDMREWRIVRRRLNLASATP